MNRYYKLGIGIALLAIFAVSGFGVSQIMAQAAPSTDYVFDKRLDATQVEELADLRGGTVLSTQQTANSCTVEIKRPYYIDVIVLDGEIIATIVQTELPEDEQEKLEFALVSMGCGILDAVVANP